MRGPCWQTQHGGPLMEHAQRFDELHDRITAAVAELATGERWQHSLADAAGLWDRLAAQVHAAGYTLERGECGGANGYSHALTHTVRVRDDVSDRQGVKTLAHELAHVLLHSDPPCTKGERAVAEVEAESVAYVVCAAAGLDVSDYSFPY